jgi:hypothetical protein
VGWVAETDIVYQQVLQEPVFLKSERKKSEVYL